MPKATIYEDNYAHSQKDQVGTNATTPATDWIVHPKPTPTAMQLRSECQLGLSVTPAIRLHSLTCRGARRRWTAHRKNSRTKI
jgi:hypothetical protein